MNRLKTYLEGNLRLKWALNGFYVYAMHLLHVLLDLLPGFARKAFFKVLLLRMGANVFIDYRVYIKYPRLLEIGDDVSINRGTQFYSEFFGRHRIVVGSNVRIGPNVRFHAAGHTYGDEKFAHTGGSIEVGSNVWIGASAVILQNVRIGDGAVVAAGSVVTRDVPANTVVAGVPAEVKRII